MEVTIEDLQKQFTEYNELYFQGKLKMPKFYINRWFCGIFGSYRRGTDGSPLISIHNNKGVHLTKEELKNTLIHEMLHYYMDKNWFLYLDSSAHLICWQLMRIYLNCRYHLHITTYPTRKKQSKNSKTASIKKLIAVN